MKFKECCSLVCFYAIRSSPKKQHVTCEQARRVLYFNWTSALILLTGCAGIALQTWSFAVLCTARQRYAATEPISLLKEHALTMTQKPDLPVLSHPIPSALQEYFIVRTCDRSMAIDIWASQSCPTEHDDARGVPNSPSITARTKKSIGIHNQETRLIIRWRTRNAVYHITHRSGESGLKSQRHLCIHILEIASIWSRLNRIKPSVYL